MIPRFSGSAKCYPCQGLGICRQGKRLLENWPRLRERCWTFSSKTATAFLSSSGFSRNCLKHVQSNSVPSQPLPNSCLLNPARGPRSNRTSKLFPVVLSKGKATKKVVRTRGFSKLTRFRNTENSVNPLFWTWTWLKHFQFSQFSQSTLASFIRF